jgi:hypothetical protein
MRYLLILLLLPAISSAQMRKYAAIRAEYDSVMKSYVWYRIDYTTSTPTRVSLWAIREPSLLTIMQDTVYFSKYKGTNNGLTTDSLLMIGNGVVKQMSKSKLTLPFTQLTGTATAAQIPSLAFTKVNGGRTTTSPVRALNTSFTPSASRDVFVAYTISITASMGILTGQTGTVFLETSPTGTTWIEAGRMANQANGSIANGLDLSNTQIAQVSTIVPAGYQVRLRTSGTAGITYLSGTEIAL